MFFLWQGGVVLAKFNVLKLYDYYERFLGHLYFFSEHYFCVIKEGKEIVFLFVYIKSSALKNVP